MVYEQTFVAHLALWFAMINFIFLGLLEGITLRKKDLSDRKNFESLLVEEAENLIGESLFEMIKIGVGFK